MRSFKGKSQAERRQDAAQAKKALLEKFKAQPGPDDPIVKERQAKRAEIVAAREERARMRAEEKAIADKLAAEQKAREEAEKEAERERELQDYIALEAEKKAARDARYAARKKRQKK